MAAATNVREFNRALARFAKTIPAASVVTLQKKLAVEALNRIVQKTPVDTGRARGNWQVSINGFPNDAVETKDASGGGVISEGANHLTGLSPFSVVYITNNLPYITLLENGSSQQAANGMVAVTMAELRGMFP